MAEEKDIKDDDEDREIVYYYSREKRLERASPSVREFNEGPRPISGANRIFGRTGGRGNIFVMLMIFLIFFVMMFIYRSDPPGTIKLGENNVVISFKKENNGLFLNIQKTIPKNTNPYTGLVEIGVTPSHTIEGMENDPHPVFMESFFFDLSETQYFSFALPFDGDSFHVIIETEEERIIRRSLKVSK